MALAFRWYRPLTQTAPGCATFPDQILSLGRALGPVWGNAALQRFGEAMPYLSAAGCIAFTLLLSITYTVTDSEIPL